MDYTSIKVGQLPTEEISGSDFIPHEVNGLLKKATITDLAAFIGANDAVGFRAVSVPNGGTLPTTDTQEFILVGPGTYNNVGGGSTITVTEELNALVSNGTYWFVGVEIPIDAPPGNAVWGEIVGTLSNQTDLQSLLNLKADLVAGKVPSSQLPSYVDDVVEVADFAALPVSGETGKIYVTLDSGFIYRWTGTIYVRIADEAAAWGTITGTLSDQTDLQSALNLRVPYTGATGNVDLGSHKLTASDLVVNHSSGSGTAASITKGGNGEALTVVKSSGTGNAASITGGTTLISELNLTTDLADAYIASAATWNAKQDALNGTGFVKISGSTISYDNSTYALDSVVVKLTGDQNIRGVKSFLGNQTASTLKLVLADYFNDGFITSDNGMLRLLNGSTELFNLDSTGIVKGASYQLNGGTGNALYYGHTNKVVLANYTVGGGIDFETNGGNINMILNGNGNLGIGVDPSAWDSLWKVLQLSYGSLYSSIYSNVMAHNLYVAGEDTKYISSNFATQYEQNSGNHYWYTAPTGTAGANMTLTPRMILTNGGNLGIGTIPKGVLTYPTLEIGSRGTIYENNDNFAFVNNGFYDGAWKYKQTGYASNISTDLGTFVFRNAPSGSQNASFSWTERMRITSGGNVGIGNGANVNSRLHVEGQDIYLTGATDNRIRFSNFGFTGNSMGAAIGYEYRVANTQESGSLVFYTNPNTTGIPSLTERMRITSTGAVGIGTAPSHRLHVATASSDWGTVFTNNSKSTVYAAHGDGYGLAVDTIANTWSLYTFKVAGGNGTTAGTNEYFKISGTGALYSAPTYSNTSGSGANLGIASDGFFYRSTSSLKYKKNVENYEKGLDVIMQMRPVTYNSINESEEGVQYAGLIAEEIHELGLTEFVQYAEDGSPDALSYANMVSLLVKGIQEQNVMLQDLKAELELLKAK